MAELYFDRRCVTHIGKETIVVQERDDYASYMLRLRRSDRDGQPTWRASLESTRDGQRVDFGSVEALIAFLADRFGETNCSPPVETKCA
jgi:hypothetical protein